LPSEHRCAAAGFRLRRRIEKPELTCRHPDFTLAATGAELHDPLFLPSAVL
jgi:hypothetical protein